MVSMIRMKQWKKDIRDGKYKDMTKKQLVESYAMIVHSYLKRVD